MARNVEGKQHAFHPLSDTTIAGIESPPKSGCLGLVCYWSERRTFCRHVNCLFRVGGIGLMRFLSVAPPPPCPSIGRNTERPEQHELPTPSLPHFSAAGRHEGPSQDRRQRGPCEKYMSPILFTHCAAHSVLLYAEWCRGMWVFLLMK